MSSEYYDWKTRCKKRDTCQHDFEKHSTIHGNQICKKCSVVVENEIAEWYYAGIKHGSLEKIYQIGPQMEEEARQNYYYISFMISAINTEEAREKARKHPLCEDSIDWEQVANYGIIKELDLSVALGSSE